MAWRSQTPALARGVTIAAPQRKGGGLRAPPTAAPGPARCAAQGRGAATPASARPGNRVGTGWAEGKKGPTTLRGAFFGRAPTAQKINGRVGGTAQGGRSPRACAAWPCAGPPVSNPPLPRRACGAFMPGLGPPVPRAAARRVGGCAGGPDRRSRGRSGPNGGPGYQSARKGRRRAATPAQGGKGVGLAAQRQGAPRLALSWREITRNGHEKTRSLSAPGLSHWCSLRRPVDAFLLYRTGCGLSNRLADAPGHRLPPALAPEMRSRPHGGGRGVGALAFGSLPACGCDCGPPGSRRAARCHWRIMEQCLISWTIRSRFMDAVEICCTGLYYETMRGPTIGAAKASEGPEPARDAGQGPIFLAHIVFR